ncbi:DUF2225 domain-containing protein [Clostridium guangxiense]|uniref:DUF2225 domain-containing protein n=1 Tax=Clostridium guangxiense TaxID=1662055 RepID=UPI001E56BEA6|nr:DUF2225 domain-containing protein [Clostridium guangxiense]
MDNNINTKNEIDQSIYLYDKTVTCPVCGNVFKARSVKKSSYRILKQDSDFFYEYKNINPYFYDVWLCNICGYASMKTDFNKIRESQKQLIMEKISMKWHAKNYPEVYNINIAIERFKISLLNYVTLDAKSSSKAMNCLKIAWMYRMLGNSKLETSYMKNSIDEFNKAYFNEMFPIYGMSKFAMMYLIGELNRRVGNNKDALIWFGRVLGETNAPQRLKNKIRDQKDLIKSTSKNDSDLEEHHDPNDEKKKSLFSKFF